MSKLPRFVTVIGVSLATVFLAAACRDRELVSEHVPDVPVHPGAVLIERIDSEDLDPRDVYEIEDVSAEDVLRWYAPRMDDRGWIPVTDASDDVVLYNDSEGCYAFVSATQQDGKVLLQISQQRPGSPCISTPPPTEPPTK